MIVGIFVNRLYTFSISDLTVLQSYTLKEGNQAFFLDIILFMISTFIFSSWVSTFVVVFAVILPLSFSVWFWLIISGFPVFSVSFNC